MSRDGGVADHLIAAHKAPPAAFDYSLQTSKMAAPEEDEGNLVRSLKDLFAGAVGGVAQVLIGEYASRKLRRGSETLILISRPTVRY